MRRIVNRVLSKESASALLPSYREGARLVPKENEDIWQVVDTNGQSLGEILQTAPQSDPFVGFSGPTNLLAALDSSGRILRMEIHSSRDTRDHVQRIKDQPWFLEQWLGTSKKEPLSQESFRPVTGATLTSIAILQGIQSRLGVEFSTAKFDDPILLETAREFFPEAHRIDQSEQYRSVWKVSDEQMHELGWFLRTSPVADNTVGYQGPTDALLAVARDGSILGLRIGKSFDNEPYVGYVRQDTWFSSIWQKQDMHSLSQLKLREVGIEGVSGATMSSMAIAESLIEAAKSYEDSLQAHGKREARWWTPLTHQAGTIAVTLIAVLFALSSWRGNRTLRWTLQATVILYLGFVQGDLLSIAMWTGWTQNGVPWLGSIGLVCLSVAALMIPIATKRNVYCSHICPYGAVQQILPRGWKASRTSANWSRKMIKTVRPILFTWLFCVTMLGASGSLVDIEPFDAFAWRVVAIPSLLIAILGILFSLRVPMGYCQHGCLTGAVINYLRPGKHRNRLESSDAVAMIFLVLGIAAYWLR